jgi:hypothetical protein
MNRAVVIDEVTGIFWALPVVWAKRLFAAESSMRQARSPAHYAFDNQVGKLQDVFVPLSWGNLRGIREAVSPG